MASIKIKLIMTSLLVAACMVPFGIKLAYAQEKKEKPVRIKWESVEGIIKYRVLIKDSADTVLVDRTVETTYIDFILPPGKYMIRIGAINKFEKISFWTDWEDVELRKIVRAKFFNNAYAAKTGLKISIGVTYSTILPSWSSQYGGSGLDFQYLNYFGIVGFHFGNSQYIKQDNFLRFMGIELEGSYSHFDGRNNFLFVSQLSNITGGPNLFIKTNLKIPLNFYLRVGGGVSYSIQDFTRRTFQGLPLIKGSIKSFDPYAKVGVSMEFNFFYALSLDIGTDYLIIFYQGKFFQSVRYFAMVGIRI